MIKQPQHIGHDVSKGLLLFDMNSLVHIKWSNVQILSVYVNGHLSINIKQLARNQ